MTYSFVIIVKKRNVKPVAFLLPSMNDVVFSVMNRYAQSALFIALMMAKIIVTNALKAHYLNTSENASVVITSLMLKLTVISSAVTVVKRYVTFVSLKIASVKPIKNCLKKFTVRKKQKN